MSKSARIKSTRKQRLQKMTAKKVHNQDAADYRLSEKPIPLKRSDISVIRKSISENLNKIIYHQRARRELYWLLVQHRMFKVGDTTIGAARRWKQWMTKHGYEDSILLGSMDISYDDLSFAPRDHAYHKVLAEDLGYRHIMKEDIPDWMYYSRELFEKYGVLPDELETDIYRARKIIYDAIRTYSGRFAVYSLTQLEKIDEEDGELTEITIRPVQQDMVDRFIRAIEKGYTHLLCAAPPRFGKSIATLFCAEAANVEMMIVASAKVDVKAEWMKSIRKVANFAGTWAFLDREDLKRNPQAIADARAADRKVAVFVSLPDFGGKKIKDVHAEVFEYTWDMLVVDEVHYGASGAEFGAKINKGPVSDESVDKADEKEKNKLNANFGALTGSLAYRLRLDLSGTPYDIMMKGLFASDAIVYQASYEDIIIAREQWYEDHLMDDDFDEQNNPYYDFPDLLSFGWALSNLDKETYKELCDKGLLDLNKLFDTTNRDFVHKEEVLSFLRTFDGTDAQSGMYSVLGSEAFSSRIEVAHAVMVLPSCAACDAMRQLLLDHADEFNTWSSYIPYLLTSNVDGFKLPKVQDVAAFVSEHEKKKQNTLCLTVDRMLTGVSIPEWNVMIYAKGCKSAQAYEQAKCRVLTPYSIVLEDGTKQIMKQQGIFIDCFPERMFLMEEKKAAAECRAVKDSINTKTVEEKMKKNLSVANMVLIDAMQGHIKQMAFTDIRKVISNYNSRKSLAEQMGSIEFNDKMLNNENILSALEKFEAIGTAASVIVPVFETSDEDDAKEIEVLKEYLEHSENEEENDDKIQDIPKDKAVNTASDEKSKERKEAMEKLNSLMSNIAMTGYCTDEKVSNIFDLISICVKPENKEFRETLRYMGINMNTLIAVKNTMDAGELYRFEQIMMNLNEIRRDKNIPVHEKTAMVAQKILKFGANDYITPMGTADEMVRVINPEQIQHIVSHGLKILCLSEEIAEFSVALMLYMQELGYDMGTIRKAIASIYDGSTAGVLTHETYKVVGLDERNIFPYGNNEIYGKIIENKKNYKLIADTLCMTKTGYPSGSSLDIKEAEGYEKMIKFGAIVGNPPYQKKGEGNGRHPSVYDEFMDLCYELSDIAVLITPGRFLFNAGQTSKKWNKKMLEDEYLQVVYYEPKGINIFPGTDIKGGLAITKRNAQNKCGKIGTFTTFPVLNNILRKIRQIEGDSLQGMDTQISSQGIYHVTPLLFEQHPEVEEANGKGTGTKIVSKLTEKLPGLFLEKKPVEGQYVGLYTRIKGQRATRFVKSQYLEQNEWLEFYNVLVSEANGSGALGEVMSSPFIGEPFIGHTDTFLSIGKYNNEDEANACLSYIKSKFARVCLGSLKVTQHNPKATWANVPLQDFTSDSDIDWSKSITEIDQQLYKKYGLTDDEIAFIETNVKTME